MSLLAKHLFVPHYTNNHKAKILQNSGLLLLLACILLFQVTISSHSVITSSLFPESKILGFSSSITTQKVIEQSNNERVKNNLPMLSESQLLNNAARQKAQHMFQHDYWAHIAPDGTTPWFFMKEVGYTYTVAGENLGRDFLETDKLIEAWMNSPTHRENILHNEYTEIGIAVVNGTLEGQETTLVVQMFGLANGSVATGQINNAGTNELTQIAGSNTVADVGNLSSLINSPTQQPLFQTINLYKALTFIIVSLLIAVCLLDVYHISKAPIPRMTAKVWAHISMLLFVLGLMYFSQQGGIL